jgi:hypothetical protein
MFWFNYCIANSLLPSLLPVNKFNANAKLMLLLKFQIMLDLHVQISNECITDTYQDVKQTRGKLKNQNLHSSGSCITSTPDVKVTSQ